LPREQQITASLSPVEVTVNVPSRECAKLGESVSGFNSEEAAPREKKLLIIHADDLGLAHSVNQATFEAWETGAIGSASVMVPCPWFSEVVKYWKRHPRLDLGVHLTITSEWRDYRWTAISSVRENRRLIDEQGYLWADTSLLCADSRDVEIEIRSQVDRCFAAGIRPTHVDAHMFSLLHQSTYARAYAKVAEEFNLPFLAPIATPAMAEFFPGVLELQDVDSPTANVIFADPEMDPESWLDHYLELLAGVKPGLNELIVHLGYDNAELQAITVGQEAWGSAWRQRDFDVITSQTFRAACRDHGIQLTDWRTVAASRKAVVEDRRPA
jgi:chitin disaccharide deacetylase